MIGPKRLLGLSRQIKVYGSNVNILRTPTEFRDTLLKLSSEVKERSRILSTLYIGSRNGRYRTRCCKQPRQLRQEIRL